MISFRPFQPGDRAEYAPYLSAAGERGCEYSFANLCVWGRQQGAILPEGLVFFSQFNRKTVYLFPLGADRKVLIEKLMEDASKRGIALRLTGLLTEDCRELERLFPGRFRFHNARGDYDYIYNVRDLALLKGKAYQSKRNFANRFQKNHPDCQVVPIEGETLEAVKKMLEAWYANRQEKDPQGDYHMERAALTKALVEHLVINVWDCDPKWKVEWFEDGKYRGLMEQVSELSPIHTAELKAKYAQTGKEPKDYRLTKKAIHYYAAKPSEGAKEITIVIKNRFGKTWKETIQLKN